VDRNQAPILFNQRIDEQDRRIRIHSLAKEGKGSKVGVVLLELTSVGDPIN
jgi:hypothetical protein